MPTYLFLLFSQVFPAGLDPIPVSNHLLFIVLIFIVTFLLPSLNIGILKSLGSIKTMQMVERRERILPFVLISVVYVVITYLFYQKSMIGLNDNFLKLMIVIDMLVVASTLVTFFFKISVHSVAAWGMIGILLPLNKITEVNALYYPALAMIILTGFIMSSRLSLNVHTPKEVMWGSIVGLAASIGGMLLLF